MQARTNTARGHTPQPLGDFRVPIQPIPLVKGLQYN